MIRAASGVNNIRALKHWENWALQRIRLAFTNSCFSPSSSSTNPPHLLLHTYSQQHCLYLLTDPHTNTHPSAQATCYSPQPLPPRRCTAGLVMNGKDCCNHSNTLKQTSIHVKGGTLGQKTVCVFVCVWPGCRGKSW